MSAQVENPVVVIAVALVTPGTATGVGEHGSLPEQMEPMPSGPIWPVRSSPQQTTLPPLTIAQADVLCAETAVGLVMSELKMLRGDWAQLFVPPRHPSGPIVVPMMPKVESPRHST